MGSSLAERSSGVDNTQLPTGDFARADRAAYELQQSIAQSDAIQGRRLYEITATNAQDNFRARERDYRQELETARQVNSLVLPEDYAFPNTEMSTPVIARNRRFSDVPASRGTSPLTNAKVYSDSVGLSVSERIALQFGYDTRGIIPAMMPIAPLVGSGSLPGLIPPPMGNSAPPGFPSTQREPMYPGGYEAIDDRGPKILTNPQVNLPAGWNTLPGKAMDVVQDISDFILLKKDSYVLGKNLEAAGYARPEDAAAHHMVASGSRNASAEQS